MQDIFKGKIIKFPRLLVQGCFKSFEVNFLSMDLLKFHKNCMHDIFITQINHENQKFCCDKYQASRKSESAKNVFSLTKKCLKSLPMTIYFCVALLYLEKTYLCDRAERE